MNEVAKVARATVHHANQPMYDLDPRTIYPRNLCVVEFWGLPPLIPLLQYVNRLGFEICSVKRTRKLVKLI